MAEQLICNQQVVGSTPITSSNEFTQRELLYGRFPEWPKGADCKSVVADFGGPNPPSPTKIEAYPCGMSLFCLVMVEMRNAAAAVVRNRFRFGELPPFTTAVHFPHLCGKFVVTNPPSPTKIEAHPCGMPQITDKAARTAFFLYLFLFPYLCFREQGLFLILQIPVHHCVKQFLQDSSHFTPRGNSECHQVAPVHRKIAQ